MTNHTLSKSTITATLLFVIAGIIMLTLWSMHQSRQTAQETGANLQQGRELEQKLQIEINKQ